MNLQAGEFLAVNKFGSFQVPVHFLNHSDEAKQAAETLGKVAAKEAPKEAPKPVAAEAVAAKRKTVAAKRTPMKAAPKPAAAKAVAPSPPPEATKAVSAVQIGPTPPWLFAGRARRAPRLSGGMPAASPLAYQDACDTCANPNPNQA